MSTKAGSELGRQLLKQATSAATATTSATTATATSPASAAAPANATPLSPPGPPPKRLTRIEELERTFQPVFLRNPVLRNMVSGRGEKGLRAVCVPEMVSLLECLNTADYNQRRCLGQITTFQRCVVTEEAKRTRRKELIKNPGSGRSVGNRLAAPQVNALLAKYPNPPRALGEPKVDRRGRYEKPK